MSLKHELLQAATKLQLPASDFRAVGITEWEPIMKRVEDKFVQARYDSKRWWWECFKGTWHGVVLPVEPSEVLPQLIPAQEVVWFIAEGDQDKFWLFEGTAAAIKQVLDESYYFEYYLVSKRYEWLLSVNHHDLLSGVGEVMIERLRKLEEIISPINSYTSTTSSDPK